MSKGIFKKVENTGSDTPELSIKSRGFGGPVRVILITLVIFIVTQILAGLIATILLAAAGAYTSLDNSIAAQFIYVLLAELGAVGLVFWVLRRRGLSLKAIGLGRRPAWNDIVWALIGFVLFYILLIVAGMLVSAFVPSINNEQQDIGFNTITTVSDNILAIIALVILPPLGEETLVRGYLYSGLRSKMKYWPALLITSALFAVAHLSESDSGLLWSGALDTFLLSVALVFLREKTGALYAGMLVHMANNIIAFAVHFH